MLHILVPVDGSDNANRAVLHARQRPRARATRIHLLNIQTPPQGRAGLSRLVTQDMIDEYYVREGQEAADDARKLLDVTGTDYTSHVEFGNPAVEITHYAQQHQCARIVMGTRGHGALAGMLIGSVANQVVQLADVPVTLVR
ncbi:universal stress protein [Achromobacter insuavis]